MHLAHRLTLLDTTSTSGTSSAVFLVIALIVAVFYIAAMWRIFTKAGRPGWAAIIPIYSSIVLLQISGHSGWWFLLELIPFVNIVIAIVVTFDLAKAFGRGMGFGLGLLFLSAIFYPILAFSGIEYVGTRQAVPARY